MTMRPRFFTTSILIAAGVLAVYASSGAAAEDSLDTIKPVIVEAPTLPPADAFESKPALPAPAWFPILPLQAGEDAEPQLLPVASNHPLGGAHKNITRAIILIHDITRDTSEPLALLSTLAGAQDATTIILAPQFLLVTDIQHFADHLPDLGDTLARWASGSWEDGGDSNARPPQKGISSFTALDLLLVFLGEKKYFPALKDIVVAGHGAGADFVLRYAATGSAPDLLDPEGIPTRFVAANASSYLYFTQMRPIKGKPGFTLPKNDKCKDYNSYRYGLENLNDYARRIGANAIRLRYTTRRVTYLAGENMDTDDRYTDANCGATLQGPDRRARAASYEMYLNTIFAGEIDKLQKFVAVPRSGYDVAAMFGSPCGMSVLFGNGECATSARNSENSQ